MKKTTPRSGSNVKRLNIEMVSALFDRLEDYCKKYETTKRDVVSEALLVWLNKRELGEW